MNEKPKPDFSMDALVRELQKEASAGGEGITTTELCETLGKTRGAVLKRLQELKKAGHLVPVGKQIETLDGRIITVPAYKLKPSE